MSPRTVEVISDPRRFLKLREPWDRLVERSHVAHPYMSHAWLSSWWESFGADSDFRLFVAKCGNEWIGAAPMMIRKTKMYHIPIRRLEALYNHHTPNYEFPVRDGSEEIYRLLWREMSRPNSQWDAVLLQQFGEKSPTLPLFERLAEQDGWSTGRWSGPTSPFIPLACDYDTLFNRLKRREQYNLRKRYNKLAELGELQMEVISERSAVAEAMRDGLRIEAAAWKGDAGTAISSNPQVERFYRTFAERAADLGALRLAFLRLNGKRIAFFYTLDTGGVVYGLKVGYDPEYQVYSPGHILLMLILKEACDQGRKEFDFQGDVERWKQVWTTQSRTHPWLFMFRDRWRSRLLHRAKFVLLPAVRGLTQ